jgi:hypothetical protein
MINKKVHRFIKHSIFKTRNKLLQIHEVPTSQEMVNYEKDFIIFVETKLKTFYDSVKPFYVSRINNPDSMIYFRQQLPRFCKMIDILERNNVCPKSIAELGSFYPYATYYFNKRYKSSIVLYDLICRTSNAVSYDVDGIKLVDSNIVTDPIGQYDLYVFSMVIEHLPCNLFEFCNKIVNTMPIGSYLYVSYPTGGKNAKDYGKELCSDSNKLFDEHLREFTFNTTKLFFKQLRVVDKERIFIPFAGYSEEILYIKEKTPKCLASK